MTTEDSSLTSDDGDPPNPTRSGSVRGNWSGSDSPATGVIQVVAAATDTAPDTIAPLYDAVDPDALNGLFTRPDGGARRRSELSVSFQYAGCDVTVYGDGTIVATFRDAGQR